MSRHRSAGRRSTVVVLLMAVAVSALLPLGNVVAQGAVATPPGGEAGPVLAVAVSTPVFADIVANVGRERTAVSSVIPAGADPHIWEASPADIIRVGESDTFISMGAYLEPFIEAGAWRRAVLDAGIPTLTLADHVDLIAVDRVIDHGDHTHDLRGGDPHVWLDPLRVVQVVEAVRAHLTQIDPAGSSTYAANAAAYTGVVEALHAELEADLATIPPDGRKLVVFHDAYTYFAARYQFEVIGVVIKNPEVEPSAREIADLTTVIEEESVSVVFKEPQFDAKVLEVLAAETGVTIGELLTDTFAGGVSSYVALMRFNRDSLVAHLAPTTARS